MTKRTKPPLHPMPKGHAERRYASRRRGARRDLIKNVYRRYAMKRGFALLVILILFSLACSLGGFIQPEATTTTPETVATTEAPTREPRPTRQEKGESSPCGDGVCKGPENPDNCPTDCSSQEVEESEQKGDASAELLPLYLGVSVHLEGWKLGNQELGYNQQVYERYRENILAYSDLANSYGMPFTWETANLIEPSAAMEPNVLLELYQRGDGVGVHADLGGQTPYPGGETKFSQDLSELRLAMEAMGIPVTHVSGVCSTLDWVTATREAGYEAVTGVVEYCLKSLPLNQQSDEIRSCEAPGLCHDPYPGDIPALLYPWRAADGRSWTDAAERGLLIVPAAGALPCMSEAGAASPCDLQIIEEALAARQPGKFHSLFFIWSYGSPLEEALLRNFYEGLQPYVEHGEVVWQTMPELIETFEMFE